MLADISCRDFPSEVWNKSALTVSDCLDHFLSKELFQENLRLRPNIRPITYIVIYLGVQHFI